MLQPNFTLTGTPSAPATVTPPPARADAKGAAAGKGAEMTAFHDGDQMSFSDLVDIINPLQHIPVVDEIYRHLTGDKIGVVSTVLGGALYGGVIGIGASVVGLLFKEATGDSPTGHVLAMFDDDTPSSTAIADATNDNGAPAAAALATAAPALVATPTAPAPAPLAATPLAAITPAPAAPAPAPAPAPTPIPLANGAIPATSALFAQQAASAANDQSAPAPVAPARFMPAPARTGIALADARMPPPPSAMMNRVLAAQQGRAPSPQTVAAPTDQPLPAQPIAPAAPASPIAPAARALPIAPIYPGAASLIKPAPVTPIAPTPVRTAAINQALSTNSGDAGKSRVSPPSSAGMSQAATAALMAAQEQRTAPVPSADQQEWFAGNMTQALMKYEQSRRLQAGAAAAN